MGVLLLVAAQPRFAWLQTPRCGLDESWSWYQIALVKSLGSFWQALGIGTDAPLFPAIELAAAHSFGHEIGAMRLPPAVFGTLSVPVFYLLVRRLSDEQLAWRAALLMAIGPFYVFYSKEARPYSQLLFTCLLFTWAFFATEG